MSHRIRGALVAGLGTIALGLLMFLPRFSHAGVLIGIALTALIAAGVLDMFGALKLVRLEPPQKPSKAPRDPKKEKEAPLSGLVRLVAAFDVRLLWLALALLVSAACRFSVKGTMGAGAPWSGPALVAAALAVLAIAKWRGGKRRFDGDLHEGFLVFALATATVMATLGSQGLWDCWETHYGEVARRQIEQDDWISMWWEDEWFYSKPILIFWMMDLGMALFGVHVTPDNVSSHAEWGIRFFVGALAIAVFCGVYQLLARRVSKRAGLFAVAVLATMPLFAFMARQAITDLPFVGLMTIAIALFLLGATADPAAEAKEIRLPLPGGRSVPLSGFHALIAGYVFAAVPQFVYLATRSAVFHSGTLGHENVRNTGSHFLVTGAELSDAIPSLFGLHLGGALDISLDWVLLGLAFALPFAIILFTLRHERSVSRLCFHGMYIALALSVMAKGLPGLAMPILGLVGVWIDRVPRPSLRAREGGGPGFVRWHFVQMRRLDLLRGSLMFLLVGSPWYMAMFVRHGMAFINRFFIHDHFKRLSEGVHGDTGTFLYYAKQLSYAGFPWIGLLPFALFAWVKWRRAADEPADRSRTTIASFCGSFFVLSFTLFAAMVTKYHHYILPFLPAAAILIALYLDDAWQRRAVAIGPAVLLGIAAVALAVHDLAAPGGSGVLSGCAQLVGLFIYKYSRPYPTGPAYDFSVEIIAFGALFAACLGLWLVPRIRRLAITLTLLAGLAFGHWLIQHYMVALVPHWTQKHITEEYYARRGSPDERLVAFQMNWKGENFYTGNRVVVKVSTTNKEFEAWVNKHRGERHFFVTEESRFDRMSKRANAASGPLRHIPDDRCNKYEAGWADKL
jgi:4-amino-4-deoxy-L-arabinose transferase-like glycosyltransferase